MEETVSRGWKLGAASALMMTLGYQGEFHENLSILCLCCLMAP
jgi:hypothetical protein